MPVKIFNSQASDPRAGIISELDFTQSKSEFESNVQVTSINPMFPVIKTLHCSFRREEVIALLQQVTTNGAVISGIRIFFGVHPDGQLSCEKEDYSNFMNTIIVAQDSNGNLLDQVGNSILIPGYNAFTTGAANGACCGDMGKGG